MNKYKLKMTALSAACAATVLLGSAPVHAANTGWTKQNGAWYWVNEDGSTAKSCWKDEGITTYHFDSDGKMTKGWYTEDGITYFFDNSGALKIGWLKQGNDWYYFNPDWSNMPFVQDPSQYPKKGEMAKGLVAIANMGADGGLVVPTYYFGNDGKMMTGWITFEKNGKTIEHYFDSSGLAKYGWLKQGSNWLYMRGNANGKAMNGWIEDPGYSPEGTRTFYYLNDKGIWTDTKTVKQDGTAPAPIINPYFDL